MRLFLIETTNLILDQRFFVLASVEPAAHDCD